MAHDFILGETGHNWSRGISVLLPKTPDSSSMGASAAALAKAAAQKAANAAKATAKGVSTTQTMQRRKSSYPLSSKSGSLNDDELAVARDGGSCERSALARVRGW